jgi:subtilisin-like proprotein convertase family protein
MRKVSYTGRLGRSIFIPLVLVCNSLTGFAAGPPRFSEDGVWESVEKISQEKMRLPAWIRPEKGRAFLLNRGALQAVLARAPREFTKAAESAPATISLPMPDGSYARFLFVESPVMEPALAAKFPQIKTYLGRGIDDPSASVRFDWTPHGFHAQVLSPRGAVYIDPYSRGDTTLYTSYFKRDYRRPADGFVCLTPGSDTTAPLRPAQELMRSGATLRIYRLACAATGEYTQFHGGTVADGLAAIVTAINRVTGVYELEVAVRFVLVANNNLIVYTNPNNDPYTNNNGSTMLNQNQSTLDTVIGNANYDIGHVFSTGGGGIAALGVVCVSGEKAMGVTGNPSPTGDSFWIDYVAHEMGHQFGANHTFNSTTSSCGGGNRNASTAYEPGSGSTILSYAGICGADDLQAHSDAYFHSISFDEILFYIQSVSCSSNVLTGNTAPSVNAGPNFTIPRSTPFVLTATGSDANADMLTFCWEERDLGPAQTLTAGDNGSSPLFRSFNPTNIASRTFPQLSAILSNSSSLGEKLPTTSRTMNFRVTARDNRAGGGGVNTSDMQVTVNSNAGPFIVTFPNAATNLAGLVTVTWNVAGTAGAPINAGTVNIRLSTDGGNTFPAMLISNTPNDGAEAVVLPNTFNTTARIKVEAAANVFFDISDANFTVNFSTPTPLVSGDGASVAAESCSPPNAAIDPGEQVTVNFALRNIGSGDASNVVAMLLAGGGVSAPSAAQNYGVLVAGGAPVARSFSFTANGSCGGSIAAALQVQDGAVNMGTVTNILSLGTLISNVKSNSNASSIRIPANGTSGAASPYPSTISVSGVTGTVSKVTVTLLNISHSFPDDVDVLLVGPGGQKTLLMSDAGGGNALSGVTLTFDDAAESLLPDSTAISPGTYRPTDFDTTTDSFPAPAPAGPHGASLAAFNGLNPNGTWSLYVFDDATQDTGSIAGGWRLTITTADPVCCGAGGAGNQPPVISAAQIVPGPDAFSDESLAVTNIVASDAESDPITLAYQWQFTSSFAFSDQPGTTNSVLPAAPGNSGKLWRCRITPSDASGAGTNFFTASVAVNNRPNLLGRHGQFYSYDSDLFLAASAVAFARNAIINEFSQGTSGTKEWVELLFLNGSDARGWTLADSNTGTITFQNTALWSNVPAGTLLVVYNAADRDTVLPADDADPSDGTLVLPHTNSAFSATAWIGLSNASAGDNIALRDSGSALVDGISYGNNSTFTPQLAAVGAGASASYTNNTEAGAESAANWQIVSAASATPATGNGPVNSNFVASIRSGGQPPQFRLAAGSDLVPGLSIDANAGLLSGTINAPGGGFFNLVIERYAGTNVVSQLYSLLVGDSNNVYTIPATKTWAMNTNYTVAGTLVVNGTLDTRGYTLVVSNTLDVTSGIVSNATGLIRYHRLVGGPLPGASEQVNSLPVISAASISPPLPDTTQDLMANVTGVSDADNDPVTFAYQWQDSGDNATFANIAFTTGTLPAPATVAGRYYRVVITPSDGIASGAPFTTASVLVPADSDGDGLNDDWEVANFGNLTQGAADDPDGDGYTNLQEFNSGTDPTHATSAPRITAIEIAGADVLISFTTESGKLYDVQWTASVASGSWNTVTNNVAGTGGIVQLTDTGAAGAAGRTYRVKVHQ